MAVNQANATNWWVIIHHGYFHYVAGVKIIHKEGNPYIIHPLLSPIPQVPSVRPKFSHLGKGQDCSLRIGAISQCGTGHNGLERRASYREHICSDIERRAGQDRHINRSQSESRFQNATARTLDMR